MKKSIYLDYAASAPMRPEVAKVIDGLNRTVWGNSASVHADGRAAIAVVDDARQRLANVFGCKPSEIVFTSGGTESDNLAILGIAKALPKGHIVTTAIEHKAVLNACGELEKLGWRVSYVKPNKDGVVTAASIVAAITDSTRLVSVMYANNEIGTIQPVPQIGKEIEQINKSRSNKIYFHTDAVQAATLLTLNIDHLNVDAVSISGHKLGGPKGIGCLFVRTGTPMHPIIFGGGQERGLRSGTVNVSGVAGLAVASEIAVKKRAAEQTRLEALRDWLAGQLSRKKDVVINGSLKNRLAGNINFSVKNKNSDELVIALDRKGISVSAASACASGSIGSSYVIESLGVAEWRAANSVRVTMGYGTKKSDLAKLIRALE